MRWSSSALMLALCALLLVGCSYVPLDVLVNGVAKDSVTMRPQETINLTLEFEGRPISMSKFGKAGWSVEWRDESDGGRLLGRGASLRLTGLSVGEHVLRITPMDGKGNPALHDGRLYVTVQSGTKPEVTLSETPPTKVEPGQDLRLRASARDAEEGALPASGLVWFVNGSEVGRGTEFVFRAASEGIYFVSAEAKDAEGNVGRARARVQVESGAPTPAASPAPVAPATPSPTSLGGTSPAPGGGSSGSSGGAAGALLGAGQ
jgi:hypothetical protein